MHHITSAVFFSHLAMASLLGNFDMSGIARGTSPENVTELAVTNQRVMTPRSVLREREKIFAPAGADIGSEAPEEIRAGNVPRVAAGIVNGCRFLLKAGVMLFIPSQGCQRERTAVVRSDLMSVPCRPLLREVRLRFRAHTKQVRALSR